MMKRFCFFCILLAAGYVRAQDMPPLPPLPNQGQAANPGANEVSPTPSASSDQQAAQGDNANPPLPPLSDQQNSQGNGGTPPLPPIPNQQQTPSSEASPAVNNPPIPSTGQNPSAAASTEASPETTPVSTPAPESNHKKKHAPVPEPWKISKWRPIVIFGGWITAKGGNESSRLAWASQEVLNSLVFKGYKVLGEKGRYEGEMGGYQWREITFSVPKSKLTVPVFLRQVGKKVWMRVGPSEPPAPAVYTLAQVQKIRQADLRALHLLRNNLGRRLAPRRLVSDWDAPYDYSKDEVRR